jgi:hypothetical protein
MESLLLFCRALSSPTMCRFIPALSVTCFPSEPPHRSKVACSIEAFAVIGQVTVRPDQPENALSVTCPWSFGKQVRLPQSVFCRMWLCHKPR